MTVIATTEIANGKVSTAKMDDGTFESMVFPTHPTNPFHMVEVAGTPRIKSAKEAMKEHNHFVRRFKNKRFSF